MEIYTGRKSSFDTGSLKLETSPGGGGTNDVVDKSTSGSALMSALKCSQLTPRFGPSEITKGQCPLSWRVHRMCACGCV